MEAHPRETHQQAVDSISATVKHFHDIKRPYRIYHGSTNSTRDSQRYRDQMVDTSALTHVLEINIKELYAWVEPNVPMDSLLEATLEHNLMPPVVMEFPGITTGGGFSGTSGESSSFRYGFFDRNVDAIEIVLGNGEIVTATRKENPELLNGAACSFGTLGVVTLLKLRLVPAKPFVDLKYQPFSSMSECVDLFKSYQDSPDADYLDGILYSKHSGVVCIGRQASTINHPLQNFSRAGDPWFYMHVETVLSKLGQYPTGENPKQVRSTTETVPVRDYLFRYDRGGFWVGRIAFTYFMLPFLWIFRYIFDSFMRTRGLFHALHRSGMGDAYIIQDVAVPYSAAEEFVDWLDTETGIYPLWLCPLKVAQSASGQEPYGLTNEKAELDAPKLLLNLGIWGPGPANQQAFVQKNRDLERKVDQLGGRKWLYARTYYEQDEFWRIYGWNDRERLREAHGATHLPNLYEKVKAKTEKPDEEKSWGEWTKSRLWRVWPIRGLYGTLSTMVGGKEYLLPRSERGKKQQSRTKKTD